jgi:hypothetical protein
MPANVLAGNVFQLINSFLIPNHASHEENAHVRPDGVYHPFDILRP